MSCSCPSSTSRKMSKEQVNEVSSRLIGVFQAVIVHLKHLSFSLGIDYIFSIGLGALLASTLYFIIYGLLTRNRPEIPRPASILPSLVAGVLCGTGQACWLVANEALQASVTFPIAATLPGAIATLIGTVFYREVQVRWHVVKW